MQFVYNKCAILLATLVTPVLIGCAPPSATLSETPRSSPVADSSPVALPTGEPGPLQVPTPGVRAECSYRPGGLPDSKCTPGAVNPDVTAITIETTICASGWTATIRPPVSYTNRLKSEQLSEYGSSLRSNQVEEDHLVPLEIGGAPWSPENLFPQPYDPRPGAHEKDAVEDHVHKAICAMPHATLEQMAARWHAVQTYQLAMAQDWLSLYQQVGAPTPAPDQTDEAG